MKQSYRCEALTNSGGASGLRKHWSGLQDLNLRPLRPERATTVMCCAGEHARSRPEHESDASASSEVVWCAHHFAFFEDALNAFGATILVDERRR